MKKKLLTKTLGVLLSVAMAVTPIPVYAGQMDADTESVEVTDTLDVEDPEEKESEVAVSENSIDEENKEVEEETEIAPDIETTPLDELNLDEMTDEEISKVVVSYDGKTEILAQWLAYMDYEQFTKLIARDTVLSRNSERYVYTLSFDEEGNETIDDMQTEVKPYYQIVLSDFGYKEPNADGTANKDMASFGKKSGKFYVTYQRLGTTTRTDTVNISGLSTSASLSNQQSVTVSVTAGGGNMPSGFTGTYGTTTSTHGDSGSDLKTAIWLPYSYTSTYPCELTTANAVSGTDFYYGQPNSTYAPSFVVNIAKNAGVTTSTSSVTSNASFIFNVKPALYTASYNGNGATGGSTASKSVYADQTFTHSSNGFVRAYTYAYDANGAKNATVPSGGTVTYSFSGWDASPSALTANTTFKAQWKAASFTTGSASATGYDFLGWTTSATGNKAYNASQSVTPTANTTLYAKWNEHKYNINYCDSLNGKSIVDTGRTYYDGSAINENKVDSSKKATDVVGAESNIGYGQNHALKSLAALGISHPGYTFKGWKNGSAVSYTNGQTVSSLSATDGDTITLTADWVANADTSYKVKYYLQNAVDSEEYTEYTEKCYTGEAETDTQVTITPEAVDGYLTPDTQTQTILGDGSTVFEFYFMKQGSKVEYTVNHYYQKEVGGEYIFYTTETLPGKAGEKVTVQASAKLLNDNDINSQLPANHHLEMKTQTVTLSKNTIVDVYYDCEPDTAVSYVVKHYIHTGIGQNESQWKLVKSVPYTGEVGEVITAPFLQEAIDTVNAIQGCKVSMPQSQTLSLKADASQNVIVYKYDCVADPAQGYWIDNRTFISYYNNNLYKNTYGLTDAQVWEFINALENGGVAKITISNVEYTISKNADGTTTISYASTGNEEIITVPSSITLGDKTYQITGIGDGAFKDNGTIKQVFISSGIISIGDYAFYNCAKLEKVVIPNTVVKIGKYTFAKCPKLADVTFSTGCYEIGEGCFAEDSALKKISLSGKLTKISKKMFYKCKALKKVTIGSSVTSIGDYAFEGCSKLTSVTIPKKVQTIGKRAFYNCKALKKVSIKTKALTKVGSKAFKKCKKGIKITVPNSKIADYTKLLNGKY